jgi:hypothetical protein
VQAAVRPDDEVAAAEGLLVVDNRRGRSRVQVLEQRRRQQVSLFQSLDDVATESALTVKRRTAQNAHNSPLKRYITALGNKPRAMACG